MRLIAYYLSAIFCKQCLSSQCQLRKQNLLNNYLSPYLLIVWDNRISKREVLPCIVIYSVTSFFCQNNYKLLLFAQKFWKCNKPVESLCNWQDPLVSECRLLHSWSSWNLKGIRKRNTGVGITPNIIIMWHNYLGEVDIKTMQVGNFWLIFSVSRCLWQTSHSQHCHGHLLPVYLCHPADTFFKRLM